MLFGGKKAKSTVADKIGSLNIQSQGYGNVVPIIIGKVRVPLTLVGYFNFQAIPHVEKIKTGGKGGKKKATNTTWTYAASVMLGIASHEIAGIGRLWLDKSIYPSASARGFSVFGGSATQQPWGYLSTYEPAKAVALRGFAYLAANNYPLSDSASLGNHSLEVLGQCTDGVNIDANPADFIPWIMVNECNIAGCKFADLSVFRNYCYAHGLLFSFALTEQQQASQFIADILNLCNVELVNRNGLFHFISYTDSGVQTGYTLSTDDFIAERGNVPLVPTRKKAIDSKNAIKVEFINRANHYNIEIAEDKDLASIESIGLRPMDTINAHCITNADLARNIAHQLLQRDLVIRNSYEFTLSIRYIRLEPMDVVLITDAALGLYNQPVIIKKIIITPDYQLKITAEDYQSQVYQSVHYAAPVVSPFVPDYNAAVGNINPPVIFAGPAALTASGYEIWCGISSNDPLYGGCEVHVSFDGGVSYNKIGIQTGETRMGVLTADLANGTDPDSTNTLAVDLSASNGVLNSVSDITVNAFETLCRVNNEFLAYRDVTLTGVARYAINYLRRGLYGSVQGANTGDSFVRCDDALFKFAYNPIYQGVSIKLKFPAFNLYEEALQDLSTVPVYSFTIGSSHIMLSATLDSSSIRIDSTPYTMDSN
jgi:hypothetical protein